MDISPSTNRPICHCHGVHHHHNHQTPRRTTATTTTIKQQHAYDPYQNRRHCGTTAVVHIQYDHQNHHDHHRDNGDRTFALTRWSITNRPHQRLVNSAVRRHGQCERHSPHCRPQAASHFASNHIFRYITICISSGILSTRNP